jgi:RNA polymerase sigma factor (sigma-70 family)
MVSAACRLDFRAPFYFNGGVPAGNGVSSVNAAGGNAANRAIAFATTRWSMVVTAQEDSPAADQALEKLCSTYWWPLYGFVRRQGYTPEEAQDLTQGFFARLLERRDLEAVRQEKGRLRSYLLASLKHFMANAHRRAMAIKRGEGRALVPLQELLSREHTELEPTHSLSADRIYERRWASTLLERVLARLEEEYRIAGNGSLFKQLRQVLADESDRPSQAQIAQKLAMTENAVAQAFHRFRHRYRELLREEIADTVVAPGDIQDELRHLVAVLRE